MVSQGERPTLLLPQRPTGTDLYGDPLPHGAVARLGTTRWRHVGIISTFAFHPEGKVVAVSGWDFTVRLWELTTGRELLTISGHQGHVHCQEFSPDGRTLATGSADKTIRLWEVATGKELRRLVGHRGAIQSLAFSPDGKSLVSAAFSTDTKHDPKTGRSEGVKEDKTLRFWDVATGKLLRTCAGHGEGICAVTFSRDGAAVASGGLDKTVRVWTTATGRQLRCFSVTDWPRCLAFSPDGKTLSAAGYDSKLSTWSLADGKSVPPSPDNAVEAFCIAISPDGKALALAGNSGIRLLDAVTGRELRRIATTAWVSFVRFTPDSKSLAVPSNDTLHLWDVATGKPMPLGDGHDSAVWWVAFGSDGKSLISGGADDGVRVWDLGTRKEQGRIPLSWEPGPLALSPDKRILAIGDTIGGVTFWDLATCKEVRQFWDKKIGGLRAITFAADGRTLAVARDTQYTGFTLNRNPKTECTLHLWDAVSGKELAHLGKYPGSVHSLELSPDGKTLALNGRDNGHLGSVTWVDHEGPGEAAGSGPLAKFKAYRFLALPGGKERRYWERSDLSGYRFAFSPDGRILAEGGEFWGDSPKAGAIRLWETVTGQQIARLEGHQSNLNCLAFSPDGTVLASGGDDRTIRLWDVLTGKEIRHLTGGKYRVSSLAFSPDGRRLASANYDTTILIWDLPALVPARQKRWPMAPLGPDALEDCWTKLGSTDTVQAFAAVQALTRSPEQAVLLLPKRLCPVVPVTPKVITRLLTDLDSEQFILREKASRELAFLGDQVEAALRERLARPISLESRRRIEKLLQGAPGPGLTSEQLRSLRSLMVLEFIDAHSAARRVLERLAKGLPEDRLTHEARAWLRRRAVASSQ